MDLLLVPSIYPHPEEQGACNHPNLAAHRAARALITKIAKQTGWAARPPSGPEVSFERKASTFLSNGSLCLSG